jgi:hypothetical protein
MKKQYLLFGVLALGLALTGCGGSGGDNGEDGGGDITYTAQQRGGIPGENGAAPSATSTGIEIKFNKAVESLAATEVAITGAAAGNGAPAKEGDDPKVWLIPIDVIRSGEAAVKVTKDGIENARKTVRVYKAGEAVPTGWSVKADGKTNTASTTLTFTFEKDVSGLTAADITLTAGEGAASKGVLTGEGKTWNLAITPSRAGKITVRITRAGIDGEAREAEVFTAKSDGGEGGASKGVYIAGYTNKDGKETPCYWLDGVRHELEQPSGKNIVDAFAVDITVAAGKVYIAGYYSYYAAPYSKTICYWVNGARHDVAEYTDLTSISPYPTAIAVTDSGKVYISGRVAVSPSIDKPCFWEEDELHYLNEVPGGGDTFTSGIALAQDGTVYIAGDYKSGGKYVPCYWKDGVWNNLNVPEGSGDVVPKGIAISQSGSVYIAGIYVNGDRDSLPCYWKDGIWNELIVPEGSEDASTNVGRIAIAGNSVYIAGHYKHRSDKYLPCYWKDDVLNNLAEADLGMVTDIVVSDRGEVYVTGYSKNSATKLYAPCFWQGATLNYLEVPEGETGYGMGIELIE